MKLDEILNKKSELSIFKQTEELFVTTAVVDEVPFKFFASLDDDGEAWHISFGKVKSDGSVYAGRTGDNVPLSVLSFVKDSMTKFVAHYKPAKFYFFSTDAKRSGLYDKLLKKFSIAGYEHSSQGYWHDTKFSVIKK